MLGMIFDYEVFGIAAVANDRLIPLPFECFISGLVTLVVLIRIIFISFYPRNIVYFSENSVLKYRAL